MCKSRIFILFIALVMVIGCTQIPITGSGNVVTQEEPISGFDKVDISQSFEVDISQGENFSVIIRVDDNLVEHLQVVKQDNTLKIGLKPNRNYTASNVTLEAEVTMPELTGLDLSGASQATISGFKSTNDLSVDLSGSSSLVGDIEAAKTNFDLSGSSDANLSGSGQETTIDVSGGSQIDLSNFLVADVTVNASGGSTATVNPSGKLNADASGASQIHYLGDPILGEIDSSGASSVEHR
jgi:hypothetical protein